MCSDLGQFKCPRGTCLFCADLSSVLSHANVSIEASEASAAANDDEPFDDDVAPNGTDGNAATSS
jgi:histone acetyltransferase (RNA polymerase elongator complex component)